MLSAKNLRDIPRLVIELQFQNLFLLRAMMHPDTPAKRFIPITDESRYKKTLPPILGLIWQGEAAASPRRRSSAALPLRIYHYSSVIGITSGCRPGKRRNLVKIPGGSMENMGSAGFSAAVSVHLLASGNGGGMTVKNNA